MRPQKNSKKWGDKDSSLISAKIKAEHQMEEYEEKIGINFVEGKEKRLGYLANIKSHSYQEDESTTRYACLLLYFVMQDGSWFKALLKELPYLYIRCTAHLEREVSIALHTHFENVITSIDIVDKVDLDQINHLSGEKQQFLKLSFHNINDLMTVRRVLRGIVSKNQKKQKSEAAYSLEPTVEKDAKMVDHFEEIQEIREDDVPYHMRVCIDQELRCSFWYETNLDGKFITSFTHKKDILEKPDLRILAYDIETTKAPLRFPDPAIDLIMMISYMVDGQGFLIINRQIVSQDIEDFEYSPKPEYEGQFTVFNEADEQALLNRFFDHIRTIRPFIFVTFNGDYFDWPFVEERTKTYGMLLEKEIGITMQKGEYYGKYAIHMDCFYWVKRDAYLPQGSHGLKEVTRTKLGYEPVEVDPEQMLPFAKERPQELAVYSASDAVSTYYLYKKMIYDFIFALTTIIPTFPDEVLRLGSGTLCEDLLMAQAFRSGIIFPNKKLTEFERFYKGHLIEQETYIGGHVEAIRNGVYRSDFPVKFKMESTAYQTLIENIDATMKFGIEIEQKMKVEDCTNYDVIKEAIVNRLTFLREKAKEGIHDTEPLIYHLDVAAMYPNIILSNRLQPVSIVDQKTCAGCLFNKESNNCKREMRWEWKGEYFPLSRGEFEWIKHNLEYEDIQRGEGVQQYNELPFEEQRKVLIERIKKYCSIAYKKMHISETAYKSDIVCMRENSFYVDTVRNFRDVRYEYKRLVKVWKGELEKGKDLDDPLKIEEAENRMSLYDSLQLAHKIILNSFYGYVMRRGARWYSMQMAAMVTHQGGSIIMDNRHLIEQLGIPLELDTDGIWCLLPKQFPENYKFTFTNAQINTFSYPCTMLNINTYHKYSNHQYQTLTEIDGKREYVTRCEMSIFFEIDGPYRCMVLPAAREEGKMLKKRYAVFDMSGRMSEIKGFELKRRGELKIIKVFQSEVFGKFLLGNTLEECYNECGKVAQIWYDLLENEGANMDDSEVIEYIGESKVLSRAVSDYGGRKITYLTCAKRMGEFLGEEYTKTKGVVVKFFISKKPSGKPRSERAIPTEIFFTEPSIRRKLLRKWLGDSGMINFDMRQIIDWEYYKERLANTIQKIISISAALQDVKNPVPKIPLPDWLIKRVKESKYTQKSIGQFFLAKPIVNTTNDIEDLGSHSHFSFQTQNLSNRIGSLSLGLTKKDQRRAEENTVLNINTTKTISKQPIPKQNKENSTYENLKNEIDQKVKACLKPEHNFNSWLTAQKEIWKLDRKAKKQAIVEGRIQGADKKGLVSYLKLQEDVILKSIWHILQISSTSKLGYFKVWFIAEHESQTNAHIFNMFSLTLYIPRTLYINSRIQQPDAPGFIPSQKILPRDKKSRYLYEIEIEEDLYVQKFNSFYAYLCDPNIEGIYQSKMPLLYEALLKLTSLLRPTKKGITLNYSHIGQLFQLNDFESCFEYSYLPDNAYNIIFISHVHTLERHIIGLFNFSTKQIELQAIYENVKQMDKPNMNRIFMQGLMEYGDSIEYQDWSSNSLFPTTFKQGLKILDSQLLEIKAKTKEPIIIILQSDFEIENLQEQGLNCLINDFPTISAPINEDDKLFPALNWQTFGIKRLTERFREIVEWFKEKVNLARMCMVPLCNIPLDSQLFTISILYTRKLLQNQLIPWYSDDGKPDLGGTNDNDFEYAFEDELENHSFITQGFYRGYSSVIKLGLLQVNTILKTHLLGAHEHEFDDTKEGAYLERDEMVLCRNAFNTLRSMVHTWVAQIRKNNVFADLLIQHLYRWISSPDSKMYDPILHRLIHKLTKKTYLKLIYQIKELGGTIVSANLHKLIIYQGKATYLDAEAAIKFLIQSIKGGDESIFEFINFDVEDFWNILLFKDDYNYGGVSENNPSKIVSFWNIGEFLPPAVEKLLLPVIGQFIYKVRNYRIRNQKQLEEGHMEAKENEIEFIKKLLIENIQPKLFDYLPDLIRKRTDEDYDSYNSSDDSEREQERDLQITKNWEFPSMVGSQIPTTYQRNPALEFTKYIVHIFGLESKLQREVIVVRRNLLKILKISEFSPDSHFMEPCMVLRIPDVICDFCEFTKDLDICRDISIKNKNWACSVCGHNLSKANIERRLIDILQKKYISYQLQDLYCSKCKFAKDRELNILCECTGIYEKSMDKQRTTSQTVNLLHKNASVKEFIYVLKQFAAYHGLLFLSDYISILTPEFNFEEESI